MAALLAAAALCQDRLEARPRAQAHLEAALAVQPEHPEALARLARLHEAEGRHLAAADALRRLLAVPGLEPAEAAGHRGIVRATPVGQRRAAITPSTRGPGG